MSIQPIVKELADRGEVSLREFDGIPMTTGERQYLIPYLSNEAMIEYVSRRILPNCVGSYSAQRMPATTYDEILARVIVPDLCQRLREAQNDSQDTVKIVP